MNPLVFYLLEIVFDLLAVNLQSINDNMPVFRFWNKQSSPAFVLRKLENSLLHTNNAVF